MEEFKISNRLIHDLSDKELNECNLTMSTYLSLRKKRGQTNVHNIFPKFVTVSLDVAIEKYNYYYRHGTALPNDDETQIKFWNEQTVPNCRKRILVNVNGKIKSSTSVNNMRALQVEESRNECINIRSDKSSKKLMGHIQYNVMESCSFFRFLEECIKYYPSFTQECTIIPMFDGLLSDFMFCHNSFPPNEGVLIQLKSASIRFGTSTSYQFKEGKYPDWMYCMAIGILDYSHNKNPSDCNDTNAGGKVYEVWDIGKCCGFLGPTPAKQYKSLEPSKRCFFFYNGYDTDIYKSPSNFIKNWINNLVTWPQRITLERAYFDYNEINSNFTKQKIVEMLGIQSISKVVDRVTAPWRQNETVDSIIWVNDVCTTISNKTAKKSKNKYYQRCFPLNCHKNFHFCDWVIASYKDEDYQKVAVIPAYIVYQKYRKSFWWNENNTFEMKNKNVRLFDFRKDSLSFREYISTKPNKNTEDVSV